MKILIVGGGGREHALAWKIAQSKQVRSVYVAPGNAGTARENKLKNIMIKPEDTNALKDFALEKKIDLTIVGSEAPLVNGIVDTFQKADLVCFGPTKAAAIIEGSKAFAKNFLKKYSIPTAEYETFTEAKEAISYVKKQNFPIVIKADGLAAGKGVIIAENEEDAIDAINAILIETKFGEAGSRLIIEEFLEGEEASFIVISDGERVLPFASSQDHKARDENDKGPNTGGMGAYSPAPIINKKMHDHIMEKIIMPTIKGMEKEGRKYIGFLYAGVMVTKDGIPKVLEFNCRLGDPETQLIMMRLKSDLSDLCYAAINKTLDNYEIKWDKRAALGVVTASKGYPESASKGDEITGLDSVFSENTKIFHAGTKNEQDNIVTSGGRVLCVGALGSSVTQAQKQAYKSVNKISYDGMFYRKDIGYRAVNRES